MLITGTNRVAGAEELEIKLIGQLLDLVPLEVPTFRTFYDRPLSATFNGIRLA